MLPYNQVVLRCFPPISTMLGIVNKCSKVTRFIPVKYFLRKSTHTSGLKEKRSNKVFQWAQPVGYDTGVNIYNTYLKNKVKLITKRENVLSWYCCGPTVYDSAHIGHGCCYVTLDTIRRILEEFCDINVVFVMGLTDIDDKIIARALEVGENFEVLAQRYENEFMEDMSSLNVSPASKVARVTDYIPQILAFIQCLIDKGYGYTSLDGSVYFSVEKLRGLYGKLEPAQESGGVSREKVSALDFALWKSGGGGVGWPSPWSHGRPGWHIECSAIASRLFGDSLDIHSGGVDLRFPHHENEEAQSCAHHSVRQWVNYWIHTGHLHLKGDVKMSKSLKNTISIKDFLKEYTANNLRMMCLLSPYRNGMEYSSEVMTKAVAEWRKYENFLSDCDAFIGTRGDARPLIDEPTLLQKLNQTEKDVLSALREDFDTPKALNHLAHLVSTTNSMLHTNQQGSTSTTVFPVAAVATFVEKVLTKLGFSNQRRESGTGRLDISGIVEKGVDFRCQVRQTALRLHGLQDLAIVKKELLGACDTYRQKLSSSGIEMKDHGKTQTTWRFTNTPV